VRRYLVRKLIIYVLTFFIAATIDWLLPRMVPGNPVSLLLAKMNLQPQTYNATYNLYMKAFGFNRPWWDQYLNFWRALLHGNLGVSIYDFPKPVT
jgi:peptide/nickel transport system permease protein